jgi:hypothetical protein
MFTDEDDPLRAKLIGVAQTTPAVKIIMMTVNTNKGNLLTVSPFCASPDRQKNSLTQITLWDLVVSRNYTKFDGKNFSFNLHLLRQ